MLLFTQRRVRRRKAEVLGLKAMKRRYARAWRRVIVRRKTLEDAVERSRARLLEAAVVQALREWNAHCRTRGRTVPEPSGTTRKRRSPFGLRLFAASDGGRRPLSGRGTGGANGVSFAGTARGGLLRGLGRLGAEEAPSKAREGRRLRARGPLARVARRHDVGPPRALRSRPLRVPARARPFPETVARLRAAGPRRNRARRRPRALRVLDARRGFRRAAPRPRGALRGAVALRSRGALVRRAVPARVAEGRGARGALAPRPVFTSRGGRPPFSADGLPSVAGRRGRRRRARAAAQRRAPRARPVEAARSLLVYLRQGLRGRPR